MRHGQPDPTARLEPDDVLLAVNRYVLTTAIRRRAQYRGYMADYDRAIALVRHEVETGHGPIFCSW